MPDFDKQIRHVRMFLPKSRPRIGGGSAEQRGASQEAENPCHEYAHMAQPLSPSGRTLAQQLVHGGGSCHFSDMVAHLLAEGPATFQTWWFISWRRVLPSGSSTCLHLDPTGSSACLSSWRGPFTPRPRGAGLAEPSPIRGQDLGKKIRAWRICLPKSGSVFSLARPSIPDAKTPSNGWEYF